MKKLSIIIPAYNEEISIERLIKRVSFQETPGFTKEIIVVNDGSTDQTATILKDFSSLTPVIPAEAGISLKILNHSRNRGKGAAIKTALQYITGDAVLIQDADEEYNPADYPGLLFAFSEENPVVYGSRNLNLDSRPGYLLFLWGGKFLTAVCNLLFRSRLTDINTGYKLFRTDLIKNANLKADGFEFCVEITAKLLKRGVPIKEIPIRYSPRKFQEGKKISWRDGVIGLWTLLHHRL